MNMKAIRVALFGGLIALMATSAYAQEGGSPARALSGRSFLAAPGRNVQSPTQLFVLGGTAFGIWTPVAPPYDVNANRNFAGNPLP
jgi:hypothetical protein